MDHGVNDESLFQIDDEYDILIPTNWPFKNMLQLLNTNQQYISKAAYKAADFYLPLYSKTADI